MAQTYLAAIEQLITENETLKSANRRLTSLCEDVLDDIVDIFSQFFPSIVAYDSDCIFKAGEEICPYYRKQLLLVKTQLCKSLLQILNLYGLQVDDDLETVTLDNLKQFAGVMKAGKGGLIEELTFSHSQIEELQIIKYEMQKAINTKELQLQRICIDVLQKQSQIHRLTSSNEILRLEVSNMTKQLARANDENQSIEAEMSSLQADLNQIRISNQDLKRQVLYLEKQVMEKRFDNPNNSR